MSFILMALGQFLITIIEFITIWAMFERFGNVRGWKIGEVALFYGIINTAFAVAEAFARGFDTFPGMVKNGSFDTILIRPRSTVLQILGTEFQLMRIGRFSQGLLILLGGAAAMDIDWSAWKVLLVIFATFGGVCLFSGLFVLFATAAFWTTESLEIFNTLTYGGVESAQYPVSIYRPWFRSFFTYVVPLATINYFPIHAILGRADPLHSTVAFQCLSPLIGIAFLLCSLQIWRVGVSRYCSTGS
jgi:ABC-2 type transport system permease protein